MDENTAALMRFQSESNTRLTEVSNAVSKLSETVAALAGSVQAQMASQVGFKELYEMQVKQLEREDSATKEILAAKISAIEQLTKVVERVQSELHRMKSLSDIVTSIGNRTLALENHNLTIASRLQGATMATKALWVIGSVAFSTFCSFTTWYLAHHS